jgi:hypothetical protein
MNVHPRQAVVGALLALMLASGGAACSQSANDSGNDSGAVTNLDDVGPQLARLRLEVETLRQEVRALRAALTIFDPTVTTTTTQPLR